MAIPSVNLSYSGTAPAATGQILHSTGVSGDDGRAMDAFGTATLDGATTTFVMNWIDGTATLPFTPSAVIAQVCGGTQPAAALVNITPDLITNTGFTVRLSAAGTNANTLKVGVRIVK